MGIGVCDGVDDRLAELVGKVCAPPTATLRILLQTEPGFFTHHDEVDAGPWYPLATMDVGETEFVVNWMPL